MVKLARAGSVWWGGEVLVSERRKKVLPSAFHSGLISYKFLSKYHLQALNVSHVSCYENVITMIVSIRSCICLPITEIKKKKKGQWPVKGFDEVVIWVRVARRRLLPTFLLHSPSSLLMWCPFSKLPHCPTWLLEP